MNEEERVELVAKALCAARGEDPEGSQVRFVDGEAHSATFLEIARRDAQAAITALQGVNTVSEAMIEAGITEYESNTIAIGKNARSTHRLVSDIYTAMRAAAPTAPVQDDDAEWLRNYKRPDIEINEVVQRFQSVVDSQPHRQFVEVQRTDLVAALFEIATRLSADHTGVLIEALEPFARLAGPINGEEGRPSYIEGIEGKNGTGELYIGSHFGTTSEAAIDASDFERAKAAVATARGDQSPDASGGGR